ncbi:MAG: HEAT repeat domain-containing protein, partial [Alphaproteobacteria bacterium]
DDLRELLKTPLVMSLFAFAYDDIPAEKRRQIEDLTLAPGDVRDELVLAYIRRRYQYEEQRERMRGARLPFQLGDITKDDGAPDDDRPPLLPILGRLAMENFGRWRKEWMRLLIADDIFIFDDFDLALGDHAVMRDVLIDLLLRMDIMQGRGDDYAFLHLYLRDALAYAFSLPRLKYESLYEKMVFFDKPNPVQALVAAGGERALDPLLSILADEHEQAMIRYSAAEALGEIGGERAVDGLLAALNDDDAYVRSSAAGALGAIGDGRAVNGLLAALNDADADVRRSAAGALERIGDGRAVNGLLAALNDDAAFVRRRAAYVLGKIGDARAVDGLLAALNDDAADVRGNAAGALGAIGDARAVDGLLAALNDNDPDVGFRAAEALGAIGDERAVAGLGQLLQDTQAQGNLEDWNWWRACNAATDALRKIGTPEALRLLAENPLPPPPPPPPRPHVFISYSRW